MGEAGDIEWFIGGSRARWEGDTLAVDVVHPAVEDQRTLYCRVERNARILEYECHAVLEARKDPNRP